MDNLIEKYTFRKKDIEYGWNQEGEAIEFPVGLAKECLKYIYSDKRAISVSVEFLHDYCVDVLKNNGNREITYVISQIWSYLMRIIEKEIFKK
jgi:hypothetical protein